MYLYMSILNQNTSIGHSRSLSTCPYYRVGAGGLNYTSTSPDNYDNGQRLHSPIGELSDVDMKEGEELAFCKENMNAF